MLFLKVTRSWPDRMLFKSQIGGVGEVDGRSSGGVKKPKGEVQKPGSRGGKFYRTSKGKVVYGQKPTGKNWSPADAPTYQKDEKLKERAAEVAPTVGKKPLPQGKVRLPKPVQGHHEDWKEQVQAYQQAEGAEAKANDDFDYDSVPDDVYDKVEEFVRAHRSTMDELLPEVRSIADTVAGNDAHYTTGRVKGVNSATKKLLTDFQKEGKTLDRMRDVCGVRMMFLDLDHVHSAIDQVRSKYGARIVEEKDYLNNPKDGYRSYHFILKGSDGHYAELQVRTLAMNAWADWAHDNLYESKAGPAPEELKTYGHQVAEALMAYDQERKVLALPPCPHIAVVNDLCFKFKTREGHVAQ